MGGKDREPGATRVGICGSHASPGVLAWEAGSYPPPHTHSSGEESSGSLSPQRRLGAEGEEEVPISHSREHKGLQKASLQS